jgi:alkylation response protein AidB-like acyl-CoA dehydrogenase
VPLAGEVQEFLSRNPLRRPPSDLAERFAWLVEFQRRLHDAGLAVVSWPSRYGGRGLTPSDAIVVARELGRARAPELINFVAIEVVAPALMAFAEPEALQRWLPPMASAEEVWCQLFSEPDAGSDLASLRTRAHPDGDGWRIAGTKVWSTWAQFAHKGLLLARTGTLESRHRGITAFVVDMRHPGVNVRPLMTMTGAAEFAEVTFTDVPVSSGDLVGEVDHGWAVALRMLENERGPYALRRVAVLSGGLTALHEMARTTSLGSALRHRLVDATVAMWLLERRAARVADLVASGTGLDAEATLTKVALTNAEQTIFSVSHELLGMHATAWVDEPEEIELYLYSRAASIYGGTAEIQRNVISERYLGLPSDPRPRS